MRKCWPGCQNTHQTRAAEASPFLPEGVFDELPSPNRPIGQQTKISWFLLHTSTV